jgi:aminomethyltransferase
MARIEAGLALINVEFSSSRYAYTDHDRVTPKELGFGWMLKGIDDENRPFIGRNAIRRELAEKTSRWATVGLFLDWTDYDRVYSEAGLIPPKDEAAIEDEYMLYDDDGERIGYTTSQMYSPMMQRHIAIGRVRPDLAKLGTRVNYELTINHQYQTVAAEVTRLPFFNPPRKTA